MVKRLESIRRTFGVIEVELVRQTEEPLPPADPWPTSLCGAPIQWVETDDQLFHDHPLNLILKEQ